MEKRLQMLSYVEKDMAAPCQKKGLWHLWPALGWTPSGGSLDFSRNFSAWILSTMKSLQVSEEESGSSTPSSVEPLEGGLKLAVTLRHLVDGIMYSDMQYGWRVPANTRLWSGRCVMPYVASMQMKLWPRLMETTCWWIRFYRRWNSLTVLLLLMASMWQSESLLCLARYIIIYDFYDFVSTEAWDRSKPLKILFLVLYFINYIHNRGNSKNQLNLLMN